MSRVRDVDMVERELALKESSDACDTDEKMSELEKRGGVCPRVQSHQNLKIPKRQK